MSGPLARRALAIVVIAAAAVMAAPTLEVALAGNTPTPDFASSGFTSSGVNVSFPTVFARPGAAVQPPSQIAVKFTQPIMLSREDDTVPVVPQQVPAPASYLVNQANPGTHLDGTATVDNADDTLLIFTPPANLPDATYTLHVTVFAKNDCPPIPAGTVGSPPSCTTYDDYVDEPVHFTPFTFTTDSVAPLTHIAIVNGGSAPINAGHVKTVSISGTSDGDTKSVALTIKSSAGGSSRFAPATVTPAAAQGQPAAWSASVDLSSLADGTLTIIAVATDQAGNKTNPTDSNHPDPDAKTTIAMAAHPSAPRSLTAKRGDASAQLKWTAPTSTGGRPLTGYVITAADTTAKTAPSSVQLPCQGSTCPTSGTIKHLTNGHDYTLTVRATTGVGAGAPASAATRPLAAATLSAKSSAKSVAGGKTVTLRGRLTRSATAAGIAGVKLTITPRFRNGASGKPFTVRTDPFGVWAKTLKPIRTATYVVRWAGDSSTLPATRSVRVAVV